MDELSLGISILKTMGLVVNEKYLNYLMFILPFLSTWLTESLKNFFIAIKKREPTGHEKTNMQFGSSILMSLTFLVFMYGDDMFTKDLWLGDDWRHSFLVFGFLTFTFAKMSTAFYKGLPMVGLVPVVGGHLQSKFNMKTFFKWLEGKADSLEPKEIA